MFGSSFQDCQKAQSTLITLLGELGFYVSWKKCASPSKQVRYLGIIIDSVSMCLSLPEDKLVKLTKELEFFRERTRASKKQIQRLCGIIAHCAKVIKGGRTFSRRIIDLLSGLKDGNARIRLSDDFKLDIEWWIQFAKDFNGKEYIIFPNLGDGFVFATDASLQGYGIVTDEDWQGGFYNSDQFPPGMDHCDAEHGHWLNVEVEQDVDINYLELIPIWLALIRYADVWKDQHVLCLKDNTQVVVMLKKGLSSSKRCMVVLRRIFWICAKNNIFITTKHITGRLNVKPDMLSRIGQSFVLTDLAKFAICCSEHLRIGRGRVECSWGGVDV